MSGMIRSVTGQGGQLSSLDKAADFRNKAGLNGITGIVRGWSPDNPLNASSSSAASSAASPTASILSQRRVSNGLMSSADLGSAGKTTLGA